MGRISSAHAKGKVIAEKAEIDALKLLARSGINIYGLAKHLGWAVEWPSTSSEGWRKGNWSPQRGLRGEG
ncbi:MAG TPA: hypothetical protein EYP68_00050 [Candidatus Korarchaeota archaeon]|nr:hypothetical protein [Candidatus Korarchaeota archaeon]